MNMNGQELERLQEENQKLKEDNELLMKTIIQLRVTLNRLISRYVTQ